MVLEKAQNLLEQLPTSVELPDIWSSPSSPALSPFSVLLASEVSQWNHILQVVSTSLSQLIAAVKGETAMLESTKEIYHTLAADAVPTKWLVSNMGTFWRRTPFLHSLLSSHLSSDGLKVPLQLPQLLDNLENGSDNFWST